MSNQATKTHTTPSCVLQAIEWWLYSGGRSSATRYNGEDDYSRQHPWILGARLTLCLSPTLADSLDYIVGCVADAGGSSCSAMTCLNDPLLVHLMSTHTWLPSDWVWRMRFTTQWRAAFRVKSFKEVVVKLLDWPQDLWYALWAYHRESVVCCRPNRSSISWHWHNLCYCASFSS